MGISLGATLDREAGSSASPATLSSFLSSLVLDGSCFCCGSPTDLLAGTRSLVFVRCRRCGAEVEVGADCLGGDSGENDHVALRAA